MTDPLCHFCSAGLLGGVCPSCGPRKVSDTVPLDKAAIAEAMARAEAEADAADPPPDEPATSLECPACAGCPDASSCACCGGTGIVTVEVWRDWRIAHPSLRRP